MKRLICGRQFTHIATIEPERDDTGNVREFSPRGPDNRELSDAPFCRFSFPRERRQSGVYAVVVNDRVVYVGKTNNLSRRWGPGEYGEIRVPEPGNPQVTNRRVNHGILEAARRSESVQVWFHETHERDIVETQLIERLDLLWNREGPATSIRRQSQPPSVGSPWPNAIRAAESAKSIFVTNQVLGERLFMELLARHPQDGMVYMKRAEAYEAVGNRKAAAADFARAESLVPYPGRKAQARAGLLRTRSAG
jgi:hypothetical protein